MHTYLKHLRHVFLLLLLLLCAGCYTVPEVGRTTFIALPLAEEHALGAEAFAEAKSQMPLSQDAELNARVQRIGRHIADVSAFPHWQWEFVVFDMPDTPNAWCLPGGKVAVYTGLMPLIHNDGELATVIAHEVGHAVARHGAERMSRQMIVATGAHVAGAAVGDRHREAANVAFGIGSELFVMLPYSRRQEFEADKIGLTYMARAGYDPRHALTLWGRFSDMLATQTRVPEFLSTHPADANRIQQIKELMPAALQEYENAPVKR